jgi:hypothetical protein
VNGRGANRTRLLSLDSVNINPADFAGAHHKHCQQFADSVDNLLNSPE